MAQVAVQAPGNLQEMFGSFNPMMWDIASQQVNDQTLGNLINRQGAQQAMDFAAQEQPFKLDQLGLANQTTRAGLPGVEATSGLKQNELKVSNATLDAQTKAKLSDLAKTVSDNDLAEAENGVKQLLTNPDPSVRAHGKTLYDSLYEIRKEKDKLAIQGGNQIAAIREQNKGSLDLENQQYEHGKYLKAANLPINIKIMNEGDPIKKDALIRGALQQAATAAQQKGVNPQSDPLVQEYAAYLEANKPAYDNAAKMRTAQNAGKVNSAELTGLPGIEAPSAVLPGTGQPAPQETPVEKPAAKRMSPEQYQAWHDKAKQLNPNLTDLEIQQEAIKRGYR